MLTFILGVHIPHEHTQYPSLLAKVKEIEDNGGFPSLTWRPTSKGLLIGEYCEDTNLSTADYSIIQLHPTLGRLPDFSEVGPSLEAALRAEKLEIFGSAD